MNAGQSFYSRLLIALLYLASSMAVSFAASESPYLYGIHDHSPDPTEYLSHITNATGAGGWITATVAVGANPADASGTDFSALANARHTVICRINYGYYPDGTIPVPSQYDNFASRCSNFVAHSPGCHIWLIGNELNLAAEWPFNGSRFNYVSPADYANCFRKVYNAIKALRPGDKVIPQATAPWGGPYGAGMQNVNGINYPADGQPLTWVDYEKQMLTAITNSGPLDGIALHVGSRGYHYADIHSTNTFGNLGLYASFFVYKDWIDYGIPTALYTLPLYVTECNGLYYWKGGGPPGEDPSQHYEAGWMQEIYAEINRYNQLAATTGKPIFRCFNMYRWCNGCDGWNIDGASDMYKSQILSDLDAAAAQRYAWPTNVISTNPPTAPGGLMATPGYGNISVSWNATPFATGYNLKQSMTSGGPYTTIASNLSNTSFLLTSYSPGTTYYFVVCGVNAVGEGDNSTEVSVMPTNGLPDVVVTAIGWSPSGTLYTGTNIVFQATVLNQGSAPTPSGTTLGVGFLVDGTQVSWAGGYSTTLAPGSSIVLTADGGPTGNYFWPATAGLHTITANVDDINRFPEGNENNNILSASFSVYTNSYAINSGGSTAGSFAPDAYWTGSTNTFSVTNVIDVSAAANPAPQAVYQSERWGTSAYTFPNLRAGSNYTVGLHFAEISPSVTTNGNRQFHVMINNTQVLTNFDIFAAASGKFRAIVKTFIVPADPNGQITIQFVKGASNEAKISGIGISDKVNHAPLIASIPAFAVNAGTTLVFTNTATDADSPAQNLAFSLDTGGPPGATISSNTGVFTWNTPNTSVRLTNTVSIRVTDNGAPPLSDAKTSSIVVVPLPFLSVVVSNGIPTLAWESFPGKSYRAQFATNLIETNWVNIFPTIFADGDTATKSDPAAANSPRRFYRVRVLN